MMGPQPPDPSWPRYSASPFPAYRYVPGKTPHPRRNPLGHSFGLPEPRPLACPPEAWARSEDYRYGIDLYNFAFWWECHEVFEGLWHAAGRKTEQGNFFQALIQLAAANLKKSLGADGSAAKLARSGLERLAETPRFYMGADVGAFAADVRNHFAGSRSTPALVRLDRSPCSLIDIPIDLG